jgi:hypothetical protein
MHDDKSPQECVAAPLVRPNLSYLEHQSPVQIAGIIYYFSTLKFRKPFSITTALRQDTPGPGYQLLGYSMGANATKYQVTKP